MVKQVIRVFFAGSLLMLARTAAFSEEDPCLDMNKGQENTSGDIDKCLDSIHNEAAGNGHAADEMNGRQENTSRNVDEWLKNISKDSVWDGRASNDMNMKQENTGWDIDGLLREMR